MFCFCRKPIFKSYKIQSVKLLFLLLVVFSPFVRSESLDLSLPDNAVFSPHINLADNTYIELSNTPNTELPDLFEDKAQDKKKSVLPIVLSASFLAMSMYGDNESSGSFRAMGAAATIGSFVWYFN